MRMCKVLNVTPAGYYAWKKRQYKKPTPTQLRREEVKQKIAQFFHQSTGTYGARRIRKDLIAEGIKVSERTVGRYMKELGLRATPKTPYTTTTDANHPQPVFDNVLQQNFEVTEPNQVWVSDITYIWTTEGWLYLAVVLDLFARKVIGWHMMDRMPTELPITALKQAIFSRQPAAGLIHHSDRGTQYASTAYCSELALIEAVGSMSRQGNPYDNACAEAFFATFKKEFLYRRKFGTKEETMRGINWYIRDFYNEKRRHSHNDYLSPNQFERGEVEPLASSLESYLFAS